MNVLAGLYDYAKLLSNECLLDLSILLFYLSVLGAHLADDGKQLGHSGSNGHGRVDVFGRGPMLVYFDMNTPRVAEFG